MPSSKQMVEAANAVVPRITPAEAQKLMAQENTLVVDVRDAPEVEKSGKVAGAVNVSRGLLEFRADPESPYHRQELFQGQDGHSLLCLGRSVGTEREDAQGNGL